MTTQSIDGAIAQVRTIVRAINGIRAAPDGIPENDGGIYPFFAAWNGGGSIGARDDSYQIGLWDITCQLHFSRRDLYRAEAYASTFPELIVNTLLEKSNYNLDGNCETFGQITVSRFGPMAWGETPTVGYEFTITNVKIQDTRNT